MAIISPHETIVKYLSLTIALAWLSFVGFLVWTFLKLDPYNTKVMITLLIITPVIFLGTLGIFLCNSNKREINL